MKLRDLTGLRSKLNPSKLVGQCPPHDVFGAIVQVNREDYIPSGMVLRHRISAVIFTANVEKRALPQLESDPLLVSIAPASLIQTD